MQTTLETVTTGTSTAAPMTQILRRETSIKGVTIRLLDDQGIEIPHLAANGYIGQVPRPGQRLSMKLAITSHPGYSFLGVKIDETTDEVKLLEDRGSEKRGQVYEERLIVSRDQHNKPFVDKHHNNIRLIGVGPNGECVLFNIAAVAQRGRFFLVFQAMVSALAYEDSVSGKIVIPGMQVTPKWQKLGVLMEEILSGDDVRSKLTLMHIDEYTPVQEPESVDGQVKWYSLRQQKGCIHTPRGEARVLWQNVDVNRGKEDGLAYLLKGEVVSYELVPIVSKPGMRPTGFKWDAVNVRLKQ